MKRLSTCTVAVLALAAPPAIGQANSYVAHVASYQSLESARAGLDELKSKAPELFRDAKPHIHAVDLGAKGTWYRVQIGPPSSEAAKKRFCEQFARTGHSYCKVMTAFEVGQTSPGHSGELVLKPLNDGRNMQVVQPIEFVDSQARRWTVPLGTKTDGASIPRALWSIIGSPFTGRYLKAAVIHDHYVATKFRSWMDTHDVFYDAMIDSGVEKKQALLMWAGVYRFGPRWTKNESQCWGTCAGSAILINIDVTLQPEYSHRDFYAIKARVEETTDDLAQLREFIDQYASTSSKATLTGWVSRVTDDGRTNGVEFVSEAVDYSWALFGSGWRHKQHYYRVVNVTQGDTLNVRASPSESSQILQRLPRDARRLTLVGECQNSWCPISVGPTRGWVNGRYISFDWQLSPQQE